MWRETNVFGIFMSPLIVYALVALALLAVIGIPLLDQLPDTNAMEPSA